MKVKIVIKIKIHCDKCRNKALKIAAEVKGVISVSLEGDDMDLLVVIGVNVNTICLANQLRKKFRCITILIVQEVKPPKPEPPPPPPPPPPSKCCEKDCKHCTKCQSPKCQCKCVIICIKCQSSKCDGNCGCSKCKSPHCGGQCIICFICQSPTCSGQCSTPCKPHPSQHSQKCPPWCTCPRCYVHYCPPPSSRGCHESNHANCSIM